MPPSSVKGTAGEPARLEALRRYAILDTEAEPEFDRLVQRAAHECGYPTALLTLMDEQRCWFKATTGLLPADRSLLELPREETFCNYAFRSSGIFVVPDAREDERFRKLPVVDRPEGYRAYAGTQLITPDGHSIGTLCLLDTRPRTPTLQQMDTLRAFATRAMALLELRRRGQPSKSGGTAPASAAGGPSRGLVLIVDDEDMIRIATAAMIERLGYEVRLAANGREALACIAGQEGRVRLVLTDIHMAVMNGLDLIRALRSRPGAPAVVAMSGKFNPELRAELQAQGVTHLLEKPFGVPEIEGALKKYLTAAR